MLLLSLQNFSISAVQFLGQPSNFPWHLWHQFIRNSRLKLASSLSIAPPLSSRTRLSYTVTLSFFLHASKLSRVCWLFSLTLSLSVSLFFSQTFPQRPELFVIVVQTSLIMQLFIFTGVFNKRLLEIR